MEPLIGQSFGRIADLVRLHADSDGARLALASADERISYAELDRLMDRVAAALQRDGLRAGEAIAICATATPRNAALYLGALRAGVVVAPIAPSLTSNSFARMLRNCQPRLLFLDAAAADLDNAGPPHGALGARRIAIDDDAAFHEWLAPEGVAPAPVEIGPESPFNIIYSSGTTGDPKGIVQSHGMRWSHVQRALPFGYAPGKVTLLSTPLYSNTTLVAFFPSIAFGHTVWLMGKFDARAYLSLAQAQRVTHTMLVPVQYQRLMALPEFCGEQLGSFEFKFSTSAPFPAALKREVLARWPGALVEYYGMTEGGGTCILEAARYPHKLHTVGRPAATSDIRLVDDHGRELAAGGIGEVVGHSRGMMSGYHHDKPRTREVEWHDADGKRFIRTGDIGRFDEDGFLVLLDRKKDVIISGGFNVYPSDLEAALRENDAVLDCAVIGVPSERWGETPAAFVVARAGAAIDAQDLLAWINAHVGKTQRLSSLELVEELPRSPIGKVLKRALRER